MESSEEGVLKGFIGAIRPPNLENAGVEDCALPPESIIEAFSIAASSLKSRVFSSFAGSAAGDVDGEEGGCVQNPGEINGQIPDKLLGSGEISPPVQSLCGGVEEAAEHEGCNDDAIVFGDGGDRKNGTDKIVIVGGAEGEGDGKGFGCGGKRGCIIDGELLPGEKNGYGSSGGNLDEDDESTDRPILVEELI